MGKGVWNSVSIVFMISLAFVYFCSKSLTPYYWIIESIHGSNNLEIQVQAVCNGSNGGKPPILKKTKCNWFKGTWVWDDSYPMYDSMSCPFIRKEFHCVKYGRTNLEYLKYRWQPHGCELPRFNGEDFLRRMKGKKIMYVGDSLSLNNFESLLCLLHGTVPGVKYKEEFTPLNVTVTFQDYDVEVILFHSEFLVDIEKEGIGRVVKMNSVKNGEIWKQINVLIFNSWLWWLRMPPKQPWDFIEQVDGKVVKDMNRVEAFQMALQTWAKWVDTEVDLTKTKVFFQGETAAHYRGDLWGKTAKANCVNEFMPINETVISTAASPVTNITKKILSEIRKPVFFLDLATLSRFRVDGHIMKYNGFHGTDCTHWCIAGVPDTWNLLLYAGLLQDT
nr:protein trichome birefringence-like 41 [Ipomoea batatas]